MLLELLFRTDVAAAGGGWYMYVCWKTFAASSLQEGEQPNYLKQDETQGKNFSQLHSISPLEA